MASELRTDLGLTISIDVPVLISGDAAQSRRLALGVHQRSARSDGPFIVVSCGSQASPLGRKAEVDLLAAGRLASGGTLFIEHVDQAAPSLQHELMLVLGMITEPASPANRGVGGARVIAAASGDLFARVRHGEFREDLFYRLNVLHLRLPEEADVTQALPAPAQMPSLDRRNRAMLVEAPGTAVRWVASMAPAGTECGTEFESEDSPAYRTRQRSRESVSAEALFEFSSEDEPAPAGASAPALQPQPGFLTTARAAITNEVGALGRRVTAARARLAAVMADRESMVRHMSSAQRLPVLPFVFGMLAGGSLVVMGNSTSGQLTMSVTSPRLPLSVDAAQEPAGTSAEAAPDPRRWGGVYRGSLRVVSDPPGADVYLNNENVGVTPLSLTGLPVGSRALRMEMAGYQPWTAGVTVTTERRTQITAKLDALRTPSSDAASAGSLTAASGRPAPEP